MLDWPDCLEDLDLLWDETGLESEAEDDDDDETRKRRRQRTGVYGESVQVDKAVGGQ